MPVLLLKDSDMILLPVDYTKEAIERELIKLTQIDYYNVKAHLYMQKDRVFAAVVAAEPGKNGRHCCIAKIDFRSVEWCDAVEVESFFEKQPSQVDGVVVVPKYRNAEIAYKMYEYLVSEYGMRIISDNEQYKGGQAIWMKLARESRCVDVFPFDTERREYYPNAGKDRVIYDGANIDEQLLWSIDPDMQKVHIVLIADKAGLKAQ